MTLPVNRRVLFVDDEPRVLEGIERALYDVFDISTAAGGAAALEMLRTQERFAVVVSDMRMPEMDGATFLAKARELCPDTVRMLLTGQTDLKAAVAAVNDGHIFRFLCKPCPPEALSAAVEAGVEQFRLLMAERDVLERTLSGTVKMLGDVLGLVAPDLFQRTSVVKAYAGHLARALHLEDAWQLEVAASLHNLGLMALPHDLAQKAVSGAAVSADQRKLLDAHPETAFRVLSSIPRLEPVAELIRAQAAPDRAPTPSLRRAAKVLRLAIRLEGHVATGHSLTKAIGLLEAGADAEEKACLKAMGDFRGELRVSAVRELRAEQLAPHMFLEDDVRTRDGVVIIPKGRELTVVMLERLRKFANSGILAEPIRVRLPAVG